MPIEVFYSYSHKDEDLRNELETHLALMVRSGLIKPWSDRRIEPGDEWRNQIDDRVRSANIILLLISPDFLASDYCCDVELKVALDRHEREHAIVIPIILRPVDWSGAPFAGLQALPRDGRAVTLWPNRDQAFAAIAEALHGIVLRYQAPPVAQPAATVPSLEDRFADIKPRVLDAAMPSHVLKDRASELLVLIRLPDSAGLKGVLQVDDEADAKPEDVRSKPFDVVFPLSPTGKPQPLKVSVEVTAPDFQPPSQRKNLFVPVSADSEVCPFFLTPVRTGSLTVSIELIWEDAQRGYRRLRTNCVAESEGVPAVPVMNVVQLPLRASKEVPAREPQALAASVANGSPVLRTTAGAQPPPAPSYSAPPSLPRQSAPVAPMQSTPVAALDRAQSFWSSPALKVAALALCVVSLGSFFLFQRNGPLPASVSERTSGSQTGPLSPTRSPSVEVSNADIEAAAAEFRKVVATQPAVQSASPEVAAAIEKGRNNLAAARAAMADGRKVQAQKHLQKVREATRQLGLK